MKAALVALLLFAVARPDLPQFHGKAMAARALTYPLAALIVPAVWWLRGRRDPYPYARPAQKSHIRHTRVTLPRALAHYRGHLPWVGGG